MNTIMTTYKGGQTATQISVVGGIFTGFNCYLHAINRDSCDDKCSMNFFFPVVAVGVAEIVIRQKLQNKLDLI